MKTRVEMPADLRTEVEGFIPWVRKKIEEARTKESAGAMEIGRLEAQSAQVSADIEKLKVEALASSEKAALLTTAEKRFELITERIAALEKEILERQQVRMWGLNDLLGRICRHWADKLPGMIVAALAPFYKDKGSANNAAKMCDCLAALSHLRYQHSTDPNPIATERALQQFEMIFARVLRGQPHLGYDYAEAVETKADAA